MPLIRFYKMTDDIGFAPNPFHGYLTLATCKPYIRLSAKVGEWICGFTSATLSGDSVGKEKLVYAMRVDEKLTFDEYYLDPRFQAKKPRSGRGCLYLIGDNLYFNNKRVERSPFHKGKEERIEDLKGKYVLVSTYFWYFGKNAAEVPGEVKPLVPKGVAKYGVITEDQKRVAEFFKWLNKNFPKPVTYGPPHRLECEDWKRDPKFVLNLAEISQ